MDSCEWLVQENGLFSWLPWGLERLVFTHIPNYIPISLTIVTSVALVLWWRHRYCILLIAYIALVICHTLLFRTSSGAYEYCLMPLWSYREAMLGNHHLLFELLLNILFFLPIGYLSGRILLQKRSHSFRIVVSFCLLFSLFIEIVQLVTQRGLCEVDDLINNLIGAMIGYVLSLLKNKSS